MLEDIGAKRMNDLKHSRVVFFFGYIVLFYLIGLMIWPFLSSFIFAGILAGSFSPLMRIINRKVTSRKISAIIICMIIVMALFVPSIFFIIKLSEEALLVYYNIKTYLNDEELEKLLFGFRYFPEIMTELFEMVNLDFSIATFKNFLLETSANASSALFDILNSWVSDIFSFLFNFFIMLIIIYAILVDGARLKTFLLALSPLPDDEEELVIDRFNQINFVTLISNGIGAIIQGLSAGIGLWLVGWESLILWTTMMIVLAFIPLVGISIVYIPICLYLFLVGKTIAAVSLFLYCTIISLVVENWFKPKFVGNRTETNSILIFFSIVGGLAVFGVAGIFYGPLIISIFLTFVELYHKRYTDVQAVVPGEDL